MLRILPAQLSKEARPCAEFQCSPSHYPSCLPALRPLASDEDSTPIDLPHERWRPITEIVEQFTTMAYRSGQSGRRETLRAGGLPTGYCSKPMRVRSPASGGRLAESPGRRWRRAEHDASSRSAPRQPCNFPDQRRQAGTAETGGLRTLRLTEFDRAAHLRKGG